MPGKTYGKKKKKKKKKKFFMSNPKKGKIYDIEVINKDEAVDSKISNRQLKEAPNEKSKIWTKNNLCIYLKKFYGAKKILSSWISNNSFTILRGTLEFLLFIALLLGVLMPIYKDWAKTLFIVVMLGVGIIPSYIISFAVHWLVKNQFKEKLEKNIARINNSEILLIECFLFLIAVCFLIYTKLIPKYILEIETNTIPVILAVFLFGASWFISITVPSKLKAEDKIEYWFYRIPLSSYDTFLSKRIKDNVKNDSCKRKNTGLIVKKINHVNLVVSCCIATAFILAAPNNIKNIDSKDFLLFFSSICLIIARVVSRSTEIIYSFYKDAMFRKEEKDRNTDLKPEERVGLAIFSLIEITFLYAPVYLLLHIINPDYNTALEFRENIISLFYSFGITTYKSIDFGQKGLTACLFVLLQVITSMTLTIFTFARYIGEIKPKGRNRRERYKRH